MARKKNTPEVKYSKIEVSLTVRLAGHITTRSFSWSYTDSEFFKRNLHQSDDWWVNQTLKDYVGKKDFSQDAVSVVESKVERFQDE